jgi:arylformamidase
MNPLATVYRGMSQAALDAGYDNSKGVANSSALMADFTATSEVTRQLPGVKLGLRYGPAERNLIDFFPAPGVSGGTGERPLLVFIHGGYWQMRAKESFSFLAEAFLSHGIHVAMVGYTLAPQASMSEIVHEVRSSVQWLSNNAETLGVDRSKIVVSGWSAGGHLTAMCMDLPEVFAGLAVSGIYDLEPIRLNYLNEKLQLTPDSVAALSPMHLPLSPKPMLIAYGGDELSELQRQSNEFFALRQQHGLAGELLPLPGLNHFTMLAEMARSHGVMARSVAALLGIATASA